MKLDVFEAMEVERARLAPLVANLRKWSRFVGVAKHGLEVGIGFSLYTGGEFVTVLPCDAWELLLPYFERRLKEAEDLLDKG